MSAAAVGDVPAAAAPRDEVVVVSPGARMGARPILPVSVEARNVTFMVGNRAIAKNISVAIPPSRCVLAVR